MPTVSFAPYTLAGFDMSTILALYNVAGYGIRTGFNYYEPVAHPTTFVSTASLLTAMKHEGFFTGNFPYKFYTAGQATGLGDAGILAAILAEGITVGNISAGIVYHSPGDADAVILAAMRNDGYNSGSSIVVNPNPDVPPLTDSMVVSSSGDLSPLTGTYQNISDLTLVYAPIRSGFVLIWLDVVFDVYNTVTGAPITAILTVNGSPQAHVIATTGIATTGTPYIHCIGFYRIAVTGGVAYTLWAQAKNAGSTPGAGTGWGRVKAGSQLMAWWVQS